MTNVQSIVVGLCVMALIGGVVHTAGQLNIQYQSTTTDGTTRTFSITPAQQAVVN